MKSKTSKSKVIMAVSLILLFCVFGAVMLTGCATLFAGQQEPAGDTAMTEGLISNARGAAAIWNQPDPHGHGDWASYFANFHQFLLDDPLLTGFVTDLVGCWSGLAGIWDELYDAWGDRREPNFWENASGNGTVRFYRDSGNLRHELSPDWEVLTTVVLTEDWELYCTSDAAIPDGQIGAGEIYLVFLIGWHCEAQTDYDVELVILNNLFDIFAGPIQMPADPTPPAGYVFMGWYFDEAFTMPFDGRPIFEDTTLFARFERGPISRPADLLIQGGDVFGLWVTNNNAFPLTVAVYHNGVRVLTHDLRVGTDFFQVFPTTGVNLFHAVFIDGDGNHISDLSNSYEFFIPTPVVTVTITFIVNGEVYHIMTVPAGTTLREAVSGDPQLAGFLMSSDIDLDAELTDSTTVELVRVSDNGGSGTPGGNMPSWFADNWLWVVIGAVALGAFGIAAIVFKKR